MKVIPAIEDFMVKELFRHEVIRKQFVSDVLDIPMEEIKSVRIMNPFLRKRYKRQKLGILDVALELNDNTKIDVEVQVRPQSFWNKRSLFLNFNLLDGKENHSVYTLKDQSGRELTDLFEVHIIELQKQFQEENPVNDWIRLFNAREDKDFAMIKRQNLGIEEAIKVVKQLSLRKRIRWEFEQRQKDWRDRHAQDEYVREQGRQEGRQEQALNVYRNCLARGMSEEEAIAISGLKQE